MAHRGVDTDFILPEFSMETRQFLFTASTLFIILIIIYANSFFSPFHYDDIENIVNNEKIHVSSLSWKELKKGIHGVNDGTATLKRPLAYISFAVNYHFSRLNVFGYHLTNFVIHYISCLALFLLFRNIFQFPTINPKYAPLAYPVALLATFLWATHPIHVTAVTVIVQRMASMAAMFYILSFYFYTKAKLSNKKYGIVLYFTGCFIFGLMAFATKENSAMLIVSILLFEVMCIKGGIGENFKKLVKRWPIPLVLFILLSLYYVWPVTFLSSYEDRPFTMLDRLFTEPRILLFYISLLFYPQTERFSLIHDVEISRSILTPWPTLPAIVLLIAAVCLSIRYHRKCPLISFGILFFLINHIIEGSFIGLELIYEHRNYLPSMFLYLPVAIFIFHAVHYFKHHALLKYMILGTITFFLCMQAHTTLMYNAIFLNEKSLWSHVVKKAPEYSIGLNNLGKVHWDDGENEEGYALFLKAEASNRWMNKEQKGVCLYNIGLYQLTIAKDYESARAYFERSFELFQASPNVWTNLAHAYLMCDQKNKSLSVLEKALEIWPRNGHILNALSVVNFKIGNITAAKRYAMRAKLNGVNSIQPDIVMGEILRREGKYIQAIERWERVLKLDPENMRALFALLELYHEMGDNDQKSDIIMKINCRTLSGPIEKNIDELNSHPQDKVYLINKRLIVDLLSTKNLTPRHHLPNNSNIF